MPASRSRSRLTPAPIVRSGSIPKPIAGTVTDLVWLTGQDLRVAGAAVVHRARGEGRAAVLVTLAPGDGPSRAATVRREVADVVAQQLGSTAAVAVVQGAAAELVPRAIAALGGVQRVWTPAAASPDQASTLAAVRAHLATPVCEVHQRTWVAPDALQTGSGRGYQVFGAYARAHARHRAEHGDPAEAMVRDSAQPWADAQAVMDRLRGDAALAQAMSEAQRQEAPAANGGELNDASAPPPWCDLFGVVDRFGRFVREQITAYAEARDVLPLQGTSGVSWALAHGVVDVATLVRVIHATPRSTSDGAHAYLGQLVWRDFAYHLAHTRPDLRDAPMNPAFRGFPWAKGAAARARLQSWARGETGVPLVDAAARELRQTGLPHNRARMIAASFLTKQLLCDPREGLRHYERWLADLDPVINAVSWQWCAGTGVDAAPWFRVFNPVLQGRRFDPDGAYVRRWLPELARVPAKYVHAPWTAPQAVLDAAGVRLGRDYPRPIVALDEARALYLSVARQHLRDHASAAAS